ncbi:MAG: PIG-L family deacetylase [Bacteroidia bacterium]|nr:PIG-L family deacetylase [Bacteroidia bacterium]
MDGNKSKTVVLIVAHPDDETLWAGGALLSHPSWKWFIVCLSRKNDAERATKFYKALKVLKSEGIMGDLDDGPDQKPLNEKDTEHAILDLLPQQHFDLIISHNPAGEYTRHLRHEEIGKTVIKLWHTGKILANELWVFAYEDGNKKYFPQAVKNATSCQMLSKQIWMRKYCIITETYGFEKNSWEAETTPRSEAFWQFTDSQEAVRILNQCANLTMCQ